MVDYTQKPAMNDETEKSNLILFWMVNSIPIFRFWYRVGCTAQ